MKDCALILMILIIFGSISYAVIKTAMDTQVIIENRNQEIECNRPCQCREYYDNGTDEWKDCMGVGHE